MHEENTNTCVSQETDNSRRKKRKVGKLDILDTLDVGFGLFRSRYKEFFTVGALLYLPLNLIGALLSYNLLISPETPLFIVTLVTSIIVASAYLINYGAQIHIAAYEYLGERDRATVKESFKAILRRIFPLSLAGVLKGLGSFIGLLLLIVPGIWFAVSTILIEPVLVFEGKGPIASIRRSMKLSKGNKLRLMGLGLLLGIIVWVLNTLLQFIMQLFKALWLSWNAIPILPRVMVGEVIGALPSMLVSPLAAVVLVVAYFKLRDIVEGFDLERAVDALNDHATESSEIVDTSFKSEG